MSWIEEVDLPDLPAIFQAMSISPEAMDAVQRLNETVAFGSSTLTRVQEEAIATVVSAATQCRYTAMSHGGFLRRHSGNRQLAGHLLYDYTQADLSLADRQMLDFAVRLTREPASMTRADVENLREVGFTDHQVLSIVLITCLFNFMARVANALGVDVPPGYQAAVEGWLSGPAAQQEWLMRPRE